MVLPPRQAFRFLRGSAWISRDAVRRLYHRPAPPTSTVRCPREIGSSGARVCAADAASSRLIVTLRRLTEAVRKRGLASSSRALRAHVRPFLAENASGDLTSLDQVAELLERALEKSDTLSIGCRSIAGKKVHDQLATRESRPSRRRSRPLTARMISGLVGPYLRRQSYG